MSYFSAVQDEPLFVRRHKPGIKTRQIREGVVRGSMKWFCVVGIVCVVVAGFARPAAAQKKDSKVEVSGGWNYDALKDNGDESWTHFPKGWYADVAVPISGMWSVVGQVSGNYKSLLDSDGTFNIKLYPYLFGVRASTAKNPKATPYAQFLVGMSNIRVSAVGQNFKVSENDFTWQAGGGVNIKTKHAWGARVSGDYVRIKPGSNSDVLDDSLQGLRLAAGVVVGFGK